MSIKKALCVGINYYKTKYQLYGCINDAVNMRNMLIDAYDFNPNDIILLTDDSTNAYTMPTRANILNYLTNLVNNSANFSELWFHYSGHGSQIIDKSKDENDGRDEVIVPIDYAKKGFIVDDEIFSILRNSKCKTIVLFDSCNSGTVGDLPWNFEYKSPTSFTRTITNSNTIDNNNIFMFSGCKDSQFSQDFYSTYDKQYQGAFTNAFLTCLRKNKHNVELFALYRDICLYLTQLKMTQLPLVSSSSSTPTCNFIRTTSNNTNSVSSIPSIDLISGGKTKTVPMFSNKRKIKKPTKTLLYSI